MRASSRLRSALRQPPLLLWLCAAGLVLFLWPAFREPPLSPSSAFLFLYLAWGAVALALVAVARLHGRAPDG